MAGQICGTTGYEEAGAQGIVAGINAGLKASAIRDGGGGIDSVSHRNFVVTRNDAYIGVLIDDLVTKGTNEPYRMFTSRSEYRLSLRQDNADLRLTSKASEFGIISPERLELVKRRSRDVKDAIEKLESFYLHRAQWVKYGSTFRLSNRDGKKKSAMDVLSLPDVTLDSVVNVIKEESKSRVNNNNNSNSGNISTTPSSNDDNNDMPITNANLKDFSIQNYIYDTVDSEGKYYFYLRAQEKEMSKLR